MEILSIIIPVYNEKNTFKQVIDDILLLHIDGFIFEIIVVESNSTDGSRAEVLRYQDDNRFKIILEDRPQGKGHAVRAGLAAATGDYILIQDADLEYDVTDYPKLLAPLRENRAEFVLGCRHNCDKPDWQLRKFSKEKTLQYYCNFGHIFFTFLFNLCYKQKLKDPFTMYKVFKRSCLNGLTFSANRFDFDIELAGKLCRKGYTPIEIPIKYKSRSFKEGKKVLLLRDPVTWLIACIKYKFCKLA